MFTKISVATKIVIFATVLLGCFMLINAQSPKVSTAPALDFTYQGKLNTGTVAANGTYDFKFDIYDAETNGSIVQTIAATGVTVTNGIFTVKLVVNPTTFNGDERFLEIWATNSGTFGSPMTPRQKVTFSPYAVRAKTAEIATLATNAGTAGNVTGVVAVDNGGTGSSTQNFVDLTTNQTVGGTKTFTNPISGNGSQLTNLNGANVAPGTVTSSQLSSEVVPNSTAYKLLALLRWDLLKPQMNFTVGSGPFGIAFDGANIWVTSQNSNNVTKLYASDGVNLGTFAVGDVPVGIAFDGANIWVANNASNNVTKLRASDGTNLGTFPVGNSQTAVAFDGANIWVTKGSSNNVTKLRASNGANLGTFTVGNGPVGIAFDGANIWVANQNSNNVTKLRASDGANLGTLTVGSGPFGIAFDGANIWVANQNSNNVTKLRASDGANLGTFTTGNGPFGIAFDGANIWVTNIASNNVTKLRASDGANLGTFTTGNVPVGIAFDGANIWVVNSASNNVTRLFPAFPQP